MTLHFYNISVGAIYCFQVNNIEQIYYETLDENLWNLWICFFRECCCIYYRWEEFWENSTWGSIEKFKGEKGRRSRIKISFVEVCTRCTRSQRRRDSEKYAVARNALDHLFDPRGNALSTKHLPFTKVCTLYFSETHDKMNILFRLNNILSNWRIFHLSLFDIGETIFAACLIRRYSFVLRESPRFIFSIKFLSRDISISERSDTRVYYDTKISKSNYTRNQSGTISGPIKIASSWSLIKSSLAVLPTDFPPTRSRKRRFDRIETSKNLFAGSHRTNIAVMYNNCISD